jgi:hypothetical protein
MKLIVAVSLFAYIVGRSIFIAAFLQQTLWLVNKKNSGIQCRIPKCWNTCDRVITLSLFCDNSYHIYTNRISGKQLDDDINMIRSQTKINYSTNNKDVTAFSHDNNEDVSDKHTTRRGWMKKTLTTFSAVAGFELKNKYAWAGNENDYDLTIKLKSSLQPATQSMPAIPFPGQNNQGELKKSTPTAIEGTIYIFYKHKVYKKNIFNELTSHSELLFIK